MQNDLNLTKKQYENLSLAISLGSPHSNKKMARVLDELISSMPMKFTSDIRNMLAIQVTDQTTPKEFLDFLVIIDSQKWRTSSIESKLFKIAANHPTLFYKTLDIVFSESQRVACLGKMIKSRLAISAAKNGINHRKALEHYVDIYITTNSVEAYYVIKCFFERFSGYSRDVRLMSKMATSTSKSANVMAIKYADQSILPYLVNVLGKDARTTLESRMSAAA